MTECWNAFCIAGDCNGTGHVDATGYTWSQRRGTAYNPETGKYDEEGNSGPVVTVYERVVQQSSGFSPGERGYSNYPIEHQKQENPMYSVKCPDHDIILDYVSHYGAPGKGWLGMCPRDKRHWSVVDGQAYPPEDMMHIMTPERLHLKGASK